jgi:hypothetical protein
MIAAGRQGGALIDLPHPALVAIGKGPFAIEALLTTAGGASQTTPLTLLAPPAPVLVPKRLADSSSHLAVSVECPWTAARLCKGKVSVDLGKTTLTNTKVSIASSRSGTVILPLSASDKRLLYGVRKLTVTATAEDKVFDRSTSRSAHLSLR